MISVVKHRRLMACLGLSLSLHAGGLGTLALVEAGSPAGMGVHSQLEVLQSFAIKDQRSDAVPIAPAVPPPAPVPPPVPEPLLIQEPMVEEAMAEVRLGIEDGPEIDTKVWIGAKQASENLAPKSTVEQAARAMEESAAAASGGQPATPEVEEGPSAEAPQPEPQQPLPKQEVEPQPEPQQLKEPQREAVQPLPVVAGEVVTEAAGEVELPRPQPKAEQVLPVQPEAVQPLPRVEGESQPLEQQAREQREGSDAEVAPVEPAPAVVPAMPGAPGAPGSAHSEAGPKSDSESLASSIVGSLTYKPGEPLAGAGRRISTVRPKYGYTTLALANPRNTTVLITFARDGRVVRAAFKDGKGTGYEDVDRPLIEAAYRWTAHGVALTKIPAHKPGAGVTLEIKFLMERL